MAAIAVSEQYAEACGFLKLAVGQVVARLACHERASNFPTRTRSTRSANYFFSCYLASCNFSRFACHWPSSHKNLILLELRWMASGQ